MVSSIHQLVGVALIAMGAFTGAQGAVSSTASESSVCTLKLHILGLGFMLSWP